MSSAPVRSPRRRDALSRDRIVAAAIEILDADGQQALTVRTLTERLSTGRGALYHHVSGVDDLLAAATESIVRSALRPPVGEDDPTAAIRDLALGLFDAVDAHPWMGAQLARDPFQPAVLRIWRALGGQLRTLGVTGRARSDAGAAVTNYVFGAAAQFAAGARRARDADDRQRHLDALAAAWIEQDDDPDVEQAAAHLREHDDREQFLAGIDLLLAGIAATAGRIERRSPSARDE